MSIKKIFFDFEQFVGDNSPLILSTISVVGVFGTAMAFARGGYEAGLILSELERDPDEEITIRDDLAEVWQCFIPGIVVGTGTVAAIVLANRVGTRRTAAMAAAVTLGERAFDEYRDKVIETIGANKEQKVRDSIAQDRVLKNDVENREILIVGEGRTLCYDMYTDRYFYSSMEELKKAQNDLNYKVLNEFSASLTDFYELIGLPRTTYSDEFGWNSDKMLELDFSATLTPKNEPCIAMNFHVQPKRNYWSAH